MTNYVHTLTDLESACGVTLEDVARELLRVFVTGESVVMPRDIGPALAGSVARCALAVPAEFRGFNELGLAVYRVAN